MSDHIRLRKGLSIPLEGEAQTHITKRISPDKIAIKPTDFKALNAKLLVKEGDLVKAGSPIFTDKTRPYINYCSPVSGKVSEIYRGEKRKLLEIRIDADQTIDYLQITTPNFRTATKQELIDTLLESGLWAAIRQRPYGIAPNKDIDPKAIFISGFDSAPLAPDLDYALKADIDQIQIGVDILSKLTAGGVHIGLHATNFASSPFHRLEKVITHTFDGVHPAGNVGVQIHHVSPVNKGEVVWTLDMYTVAAIGRLFTKGIYDVKKVIAVTGPRAHKPSYIECVPGINISAISEYVNLKGDKNTNEHPLSVRYISGNVLTGDNVGKDGYLGFFHNQITLINEGNYHEMLGWIKPFRMKKFSISRSYFSWLFPGKRYSLDTNLNGGERAFVMTGVYEKVLPMDIYPLYLFKAILAEDIDKMEAMGIYEVVEDDFALCEFVCPSKTDIQEIISKGINLMIKEMS